MAFSWSQDVGHGAAQRQSPAERRNVAPTMTLAYEEARDIWMSLDKRQMNNVLRVDELRLRASFLRGLRLETEDETSAVLQATWRKEFEGGRSALLRDSLVLLFCFLHGKWEQGNNIFHIPALQEHFRRVDLASRADIVGRTKVQEEAIAVVCAANHLENEAGEEVTFAKGIGTTTTVPQQVFARCYLRELDRNLAMLASWQTWSLANLVLQAVYSLYLLVFLALEPGDAGAIVIYEYGGVAAWTLLGFSLIFLFLLTSLPGRSGTFWMSKL